MHRQGLDPQRVEWLALTKGTLEHLEQYAQIDIALDPIPNGGCTTTCEALWMGVPTITLAGSHYVSRSIRLSWQVRTCRIGLLIIVLSI